MAKRSDDQLYNLPETSSASKGVKHKLDTLLREAHSLKGVEKRLKEIKAEMIDLVQQHGLVSEADGTIGTRIGDLCCVVRYSSGRKSLDRELLVENGVTPGQIAASMKEGNGFWACELPKIGED